MEGYMTNKIEFLEQIEQLRQLGATQGNELSLRQVEEFFAPVKLDEQQMKLLGEFMMSKKIILEGYEPEEVKEAEKLRDFTYEEEKFIHQYEEELAGIKACSPEECIDLCQQLADGEAVMDQVSACYLQKVYDEAMKYSRRSVLLHDLVQEGNLGLMMALADIAQANGQYDYFIMKQVRLSIQGLLEGESDVKIEAARVAKKLNSLVEIMERIKKDNPEFTLADVAAESKMDLEEIEDLLRVAGEQEDEEEYSHQENE